MTSQNDMCRNSLIGKKIGNFVIKKLLGSGGMGDVYLAVDADLERKIALKIIKEKDQENTIRFLREAKFIAALDHPNIVKVYSIGNEGEILYIAMEYVEGVSLEDEIRLEPLSEKQVWKYGLEICEALNAALKSGIIHRDIKPGNILITKSLTTKLVDFGISKKMNDSNNLTKDMILGSPDYISPERILGQSADFRSDIYSLGATLYEALTGKQIFPAATAMEVFVKHRIELVIPPQIYIASLSLASSAILGKMLQKSPSDRYQSYENLIADILALLNERRLLFANDPEIFNIYTVDPRPNSNIVKRVFDKLSAAKQKPTPLQPKEKKKSKEGKQNEKDLKKIFATPSYVKRNKVTKKKTKDENKTATDIAISEFRKIYPTSSHEPMNKITQKRLLSDAKTKKSKNTLLKTSLKKMAEEVDGVLFVSIIDLDGMPVVEHNPEKLCLNTVGAKFAMLIKLLQKSTKELKVSSGELEENLAQFQNMWISAYPLMDKYFMCVGITMEGTLGNLRMVCQKYKNEFKKFLFL